MARGFASLDDRGGFRRALFLDHRLFNLIARPGLVDPTPRAEPTRRAFGIGKTLPNVFDRGAKCAHKLEVVSDQSAS
jgi:hypothetical protein